MIIKFNKLSKIYNKKHALNEVTFKICDGVYGLLGTNGAGKTTLINIFMGIIESDGGYISVDDVDIKELGVDFLSQLGYLPQQVQFYKNFSVMEFMNYMSALKGIPKDIGDKRIDELLYTVNLEDAREKKVGALSGGMKQRLGIAQAMLNYPKILILDEPTAGLDPQERIRFRNLISKFSEDRIVIIATHIVSDIEFIANEVIMLKDGKLVVQGKSSELTSKINGFVWNVVIKDKIVPTELKKYQISNIIREKDGIHLRIVSKKKPEPNAIEITPNLEDVFLYYCGEELYD